VGFRAEQFDDERDGRHDRETKVDKIDGRTMSVKYKDGEKKVFVPANVR